MPQIIKPQITYLLGAGASYHALPLVKAVWQENKQISPGLSKDLEVLADFLFHSGNISPKYNEIRKKMMENLKDLSRESSKFITVDTYAKFLYLKQKSRELETLKETLSFFFTARQFVDRKFDERYLVYLINILESGVRFPENVKIISYNYDFQVQIAERNFSQGLINFYPCSGIQSLLDKGEDYNLIQLNGIAGLGSILEVRRRIIQS